MIEWDFMKCKLEFNCILIIFYFPWFFTHNHTLLCAKTRENEILNLG